MCIQILRQKERGSVMYDFSGLLFRLFGVSGIICCIGILCIFFEKKEIQIWVCNGSSCCLLVGNLSSKNRQSICIDIYWSIRGNTSEFARCSTTSRDIWIYILEWWRSKKGGIWGGPIPPLFHKGVLGAQPLRGWSVGADNMVFWWISECDACQDYLEFWIILVVPTLELSRLL